MSFSDPKRIKKTQWAPICQLSGSQPNVISDLRAHKPRSTIIWCIIATQGNRFMAAIHGSRETNLSGFTTTRLADQDESLAVLQNPKELLFLLPNRKRLPLLQYLVIPGGVGPPIPAVHKAASAAATIAAAVGQGAVHSPGLGGDGGIAHHVKKAHLSLPLCSHQSPVALIERNAWSKSQLLVGVTVNLPGERRPEMVTLGGHWLLWRRRLWLVRTVEMAGGAVGP